MKALIIGATGSTGKALLTTLLKDESYTAVVIFTRRSTGVVHPKLTEEIIDFSNLREYEQQITGDVFFSCLGTTLKAAGSKEKQRKIDFDIPAEFAKIAKENQVPSFVLVSSAGASAQSTIFYSKMKGELEDFISGLNFTQYIVFKPGMLLRDGSDRTGEKVGVSVISFFNSVGLFKKYRPLPTTLLAEKLAKAPKALPMGTTVVSLEKIADF